MGSSAEASDSTERIIRAATRLFAEHGFDGVSTREIAKAVDLNISTVNYHVGTKRDLYREVFRRLHEREHRLITELVRSATDEILGDPRALGLFLERLADAAIDLLLDEPEIARLWVRRWLEPRGVNDNFEAEYSVPLFQVLRQFLERAEAAGAVRIEGLDLRMVLMSFTWLVYGYFTRGPLDWENALADPFDPQQVAAFRSFLHEYIRRMLALPS